MRTARLRQLVLISAAALVMSVCTCSARAQAQFASCLPKDVNTDEIVADAAKSSVNAKLAKLKARCYRGRLVDAKRREIRFFRPGCWGNPPADYLEIQEQQRRELARLKKKYVVIEITCSLKLSASNTELGVNKDIALCYVLYLATPCHEHNFVILSYRLEEP